MAGLGTLDFGFNSEEEPTIDTAGSTLLDRQLAGVGDDTSYLDSFLAEEQALIPEEDKIAPTKEAEVEAKYEEKAQNPRLAWENRDGTPRDNLQYQSQNSGFSATPYGAVSNQNKIYNTFNSDQLQQVWSNVYNERIYTDDKGLKYQMPGSDGQRVYLEDQKQKTGYIYGGNSKTDEGIDKFGYASGGVKPRYKPGTLLDDNGQQVRKPDGELYGWESGPEGIDEDSAYMDWELPEATAKQFEAIIHGNLGNIKSRTVIDDGSPEAIAKREALGGGASEYYDDKTMGLLGGNQGDRGGIIKTEPNVNDGFWGENIDVMQSQALGLGAEIKSLYDKMNAPGEALRAKEPAGEQNALSKWLSSFDPDTGDFMGTGRNAKDFLNNPGGIENKFAEWNRDVATGVSGSFRESYNQDMKKISKAYEEGNTMEWLKLAVPNVGTLLAQSLPEMALIMSPMGITVAVGKRVSTNMDTYKKNNNGEEMPKDLILKSAAWEYVNLAAEKLLVKTGVGKVKDIVKNKTRDKLWKKAGYATGGIFMAAGGEYIQEGSETVSEDYVTQNQGDKKMTVLEIIQKPETGNAAALGALMGGSLATGGVAGGTTLSLPGKYLDYQKEKTIVADIENMSDSDFELQVEDMKISHEENTQEILDFEDELEVLNATETVDDLDFTSDHAAPILYQQAEAELLESDEFIEANSEEINQAIEKDVSDEDTRSIIALQLGLEENVSDQEIMETFNENLAENATLLDPEMVQEIKDREGQAFVDSKKEIVFNNVKAYAKNLLEGNKKRLEEHNKIIEEKQGKALDTRQKLDEQGKTGSRSDEDITRNDLPVIKNEAKESVASVLQALYSVIPGTPSKRKSLKKQVTAKLKTYSDRALKDFVKTEENTIYSDMAEDILYSREESAIRGGSEGKGRNIDYDTDSKLDKEADSVFSLDPSEKANNYQKVRRLVSQDNLETQEEYDKIEQNIKDLETNGSITARQAAILDQRLKENKGNFDPEVTYDGAISTFETAKDIQNSIDKANKKATKWTKKLVNLVADENASEEEMNVLRKKIAQKNAFIRKRTKELDAVNKVQGGSQTQTQNQPVVDDTEEVVEDEVVEENTTEDAEEEVAEEVVEEAEEQTEEAEVEAKAETETKVPLTTQEIMDVINDVSNGKNQFTINELIAEGIIDEDMNIIEIMTVDEFFENEDNIC